MTNGYSGAGGVPEKIVEKMIDHINVLSTNVNAQAQSTHALTKEMDTLADSLSKVLDKLATPPRHEEIYSKMTEIEVNVETVTKNQIGLVNIVKSIIKEIRIYFIAIAVASLITGTVLTIYNYTKEPAAVVDSSHDQLKKEIQDLKELMEKLHKADFDKVRNLPDPIRK